MVDGVIGWLFDCAGVRCDMLYPGFRDGFANGVICIAALHHLATEARFRKLLLFKFYSVKLLINIWQPRRPDKWQERKSLRLYILYIITFKENSYTLILASWEIVHFVHHNLQGVLIHPDISIMRDCTFWTS